jgi:hypothetical protein
MTAKDRRLGLSMLENARIFSEFNLHPRWLTGWVAVLAMVLGACSPMRYVHGVPNLDVVEWGDAGKPAVVRFGQPDPKAGLEPWKYLHDNYNVHVIVKLNSDDEGSDELAVEAGISLIKLPIPPFDGTNIVQDVQQDVQGPSSAQDERIQELISLYRSMGVGIHCSHGQDRTGYEIFKWRRRNGWGCARAFNEALKHHFHPALVGLQDRIGHECPGL